MKKTIITLLISIAATFNIWATDYSKYSNEELDAIVMELENKYGANLSEEEILVIYNENIDLMEELNKRAEEEANRRKAIKQAKIDKLMEEIEVLTEECKADYNSENLLKLRKKQKDLLILQQTDWQLIY